MPLSDSNPVDETDQQAATPTTEDPAWWESSEPSPGATPPRSQTAEMHHAAAPEESEPEAEPETVAGAPEAAEIPPDPSSPADGPEAAPAGATAAPEGVEVAPEKAAAAPEGVADDDETPTAPYSALKIEQTTVAAEAPADDDLPEDGTRQLEASSAPALSAVSSRQGLAAAAVRDIGRVREVNQDSVFAMLTTLPREGAEVPVGLFVVADGMGGHQGGEVASRLAVRTVAHHVLSQLVLPALDDRLSEALQPIMIGAVQAANDAIWDSAQVLGSDMGTTCTAVLLVGGSLYIAHVGDSRAYLFEPGGLRQLSTDHSTVGRLIQLGQLDPSEAREHPLRNQLYRTIGQQPQVMVDFVYQPVGQSSHLLLCSDGLWGMVDEALMEQALLRSVWPQDACNELIALANLAGGDDNISAVVVTLPLVER